VSEVTTRPRHNVRECDRADVLASAECRYCGDLIGPFEVDHIVPLSRGGTNDRINLACACVSCNTQKANHQLHEWIQWRKANGMFWPPIAQHSTDPRHYPDHCTPCRDRHDRVLDAVDADPSMADKERPKLANPVAYALVYVGDGYRAHYRCDEGHSWTCYWALGTWYYTDCECDYCAAHRMTDAA